MLIRLQSDDSRPLFEQITSAIRRQIADGDLAPGDRLPSGRDLASAVGVTLETVQRAYRELADQGVVVSRVGRGTSISPDIDPGSLGIDEEISRLIERARRTGLDLQSVLGRVSAQWNT